MGLLGAIIGAEKYGFEMFTAFAQAILEMAMIPEENETNLELYTKEHTLMGMVRLLDFCMNYRTQLLPEIIIENIKPPIESLLSEANKYLEKKIEKI